MLSSLVESIHSDDLNEIVGVKTWVPQNFEDSEQATHSAVPVFAENTMAYDQRAKAEVGARMSRAADYADSIEPTDEWTEDELKSWGVPRFELLPSEVVCNDGIIRPVLSLRDHVTRAVSSLEPATVTEIDETGAVSTVESLPDITEPKYLAGIDPKLVPAGCFIELEDFNG